MKTFSVIIGLLCGIVSILCMSWTPLVICFCIIVVCALLQLSEGVAAIGRPTAAEQAKAEQAKAEQAKAEQARAEQAKAEQAKAEQAKATAAAKHAKDETLVQYFACTCYEN